MMAVGDVERVDLRERVDDVLVLVGRNLPHLVAHAVRRDEIKQRVRPHDAIDDVVDLPRVAIGEKHRSGLRADCEHVARAIVFLVGTRLLVLLDQIAIVFIDRETGGDAALHVAPHAQAIDVEARDVLDDERRLVPERRERVRGLIVGGIRMRIRVGGEIDLGPRHVQEAQSVAVGQHSSFVAVHNIVGNGRHIGGGFRRGTQRGERIDGRHEPSIIGAVERRSRAVGQGSCTRLK